MSIVDLLAELDKLNHTDKLRVIEYLAYTLEINADEQASPATQYANRTFEVWLPLQDAGGAIATMHKALQDYRNQKRNSS